MSARSGFGSAKRAALSRRDVDVDFATAVRERAWVLRMSYALSTISGETKIYSFGFSTETNFLLDDALRLAPEFANGLGSGLYLGAAEATAAQPDSASAEESTEGEE